MSKTKAIIVLACITIFSCSPEQNTEKDEPIPIHQINSTLHLLKEGSFCKGDSLNVSGWKRTYDNEGNDTLTFESKCSAYRDLRSIFKGDSLIDVQEKRKMNQYEWISIKDKLDPVKGTRDIDNIKEISNFKYSRKLVEGYKFRSGEFKSITYIKCSMEVGDTKFRMDTLLWQGGTDFKAIGPLEIENGFGTFNGYNAEFLDGLTHYKIERVEKVPNKNP